MRTLQLGASVEVSALALGCLNFGSKTDKEMSYRLLDQYVAAGGSFLDTSNNYAFWNEGCVGGESERLLGKWMSERRNRERIFLATKVGAQPTFPGGGFEAKEGLGRKAIKQALDESLKRLGTDYIDLYYAHIDDDQAPLEETLETLDELVRSGKVRRIGCSNYRMARLLEAKAISNKHGWASYCCIQQRYTYLQPRPGADFGIQVSAEQELLEYCRIKEDFSMLAYSPLLFGSYTRPEVDVPEQYKWEANDARMDVLREVAAQTGGTINQIVLAWLMQGSPTIIPVIAASTPGQLEENLGSLEIRLSQEQLDRLNTA